MADDIPESFKQAMREVRAGEVKDMEEDMFHDSEPSTVRPDTFDFRVRPLDKTEFPTVAARIAAYLRATGRKQFTVLDSGSYGGHLDG